MKKFLIMLVSVGLLMVGLTATAPAAFACTGAGCEHSEFDFYGNTHPIGTHYYAFNAWFQQHNAGEGRTDDAMATWDNIAENNSLNLNLVKTNQTGDNKYLGVGGANWFDIVNSDNICPGSNNIPFNWSTISPAHTLVAYDTSWGGPNNTLAVTNLQLCSGSFYSIIAVNGENPQYSFNDAFDSVGNDYDFQGVLTHEIDHSIGFGTTGASGCDIPACGFIGFDQYSQQHWPMTGNNNSGYNCDKNDPTVVPTMCPAVINFSRSYHIRTPEHDDKQELIEAF